MKNKQISQRLALLTALACSAGLLLSGCGKKNDPSTNPTDVTMSAETTPEPDPYEVEPSHPEAVLTAYLRCLQDGKDDVAEGYVWPAAQSAAGEASKQFWGNLEQLGYTSLDDFSVEQLGSSPQYSIYRVDMELSPASAAGGDGEFVSNGAVSYEDDEPTPAPAAEPAPEQPEEAAQQPEEADQAADVPQPQQELTAEQLDALIPYDETDGQGQEEPAEGAIDDEEAQGAQDDAVQGSGKESLLMTVVHADNRYYVSPDNFLASYTEEDTRTTLERHAESMSATDPEQLDEEEEPFQGVFARVMSARRYATSLSIDIRVENLTEQTVQLGSPDSPPVLSASGIAVQAGPTAAVSLAEQYGFDMLGPNDGAIEDTFSTFAPESVTMAPGETVYLNDVRFEGNFDWIYWFTLHDISGWGEETSCAVEVEHLQADPGGLEVRNSFVDPVDEDGNEIAEQFDYDLEGNFGGVNALPAEESAQPPEAAAE